MSFPRAPDPRLSGLATFAFGAGTLAMAARLRRWARRPRHPHHGLRTPVRDALESLADRCGAAKTTDEVIDCCLHVLRRVLRLEDALLAESLPDGRLRVVQSLDGTGAAERLASGLRAARVAIPIVRLPNGRPLVLVGIGRQTRPPRGYERVVADRIGELLRRTYERLERERAVRDQLRFTREITGSVDEGLCATDQHGRIVFMNTAAERLLGWTEAEVLGRRFHELASCHVPGTDRCLLVEATRNSAPVAASEVCYRRRDASKVTVAVRYAPFEHDSSVRGVVASFHDVTAEREAARERQRLVDALAAGRARLDAVIEQLPVGIAIVDAQGRTERMNAVYARIVEGIPRGGFIVEKPDGERYTCDEMPVLRSLRTGEVVEREELRIKRANGSWATLLVSSAPIRDEHGRITAAVASAFDISDRKRIESELQDSKQRYEYAARATNDVLYDWDVDTGEIRWSAALKEMFGFEPAEDELGLAWWDRHLHPADRERVEKRLSDALASAQESWADEYRFQRVDGTYASVLDRGYVVRDAAGRARRMIGTMLDVTARTRAEQVERFLSRASTVLAGNVDHRASLVRVAELCVRHVADGCAIELANEEGTLETIAVAHADAASEARIAARFDAMRALGERGLLDRVFEDGRSAMHPDGERDLADGQLAEMLGAESWMCVPLGTHDGTVGTLTLWRGNGPDRYLPEDLAVAEDLARRIGSAVEVGVLYRRAQDATRVRERFLSIASHELRTPITVAQLTLQRCLQRARELPAELPQRDELVAALTRAERQERRLTHLVRDLLDVSRLSEGRIRLEKATVDLSMLVLEALDGLGPQFEAGGYRVDVEAPRGVRGRWDPVRISQVVLNLLGNAIKYGQGRPILVRVGREGGAGVLVIEDHGIGIPEGQIQRIFGAFERAVDANVFSGAGLGLFITRQIVDAHGGTIGVESRAGVGSRFVVRLPLEASVGAGVAVLH